jgi:hypothetical protein
VSHSQTRNNEEDCGLALMVEIFFIHTIPLLSNLLIDLLQGSFGTREFYRDFT